jgi:glyoxylase-like metal-dependent hydrolase (beta-lactamase superfamily II)
MCPLGRKGLEGRGRWTEKGSMVCHCLVVETSDGLVVIDSGFGLDDVRNANERVGRGFQLIAGYEPREEQTLLRQIEALGFAAGDVRHLAVTHLDVDHAGGLPDFPNAKIHLHARERQAVREMRRLVDHQRYKPAQWAHGPDWLTYEGGGETWEGFANVRKLEGPREDILLVPLFGHTAGHIGLVVPSADGERQILHAGDAYFSHLEMDKSPYCPLFLDVMQRSLSIDETVRLDNQRRLRELALKPGGKVDVICAHDPLYLERFQASTATAA